MLRASDKVNFSMRVLSAGLHELKAIQRLGPSCKAVSHVLGAVRVREDAAADVDGAGSGERVSDSHQLDALAGTSGEAGSVDGAAAAAERVRAAPRGQRKSLDATHLMLIQPLGTPLYGSELTDPVLAWQVRCLGVKGRGEGRKGRERMGREMEEGWKG